MINKLVENIKRTGAPIVVGLDPMLNYIPEQVQKKAFSEYGETLEGAAEAIWQFNKEIVDKTYDLIPAVKPQIAMYEQFGLPGLEAFKKTTGDILRELRGSLKAPGQERIYTAGEKEYLVWQYRKDKGVPVGEAVQKEIIEIRNRLHLSYHFPFED